MEAIDGVVDIEGEKSERADGLYRASCSEVLDGAFRIADSIDGVECGVCVIGAEFDRSANELTCPLFRPKMPVEVVDGENRLVVI